MDFNHVSCIGMITKAIQFQMQYDILASISVNFKLLFLMVFANKMPLDNTYGLPNLFEFKWNHFKNVFKKQNMNLENSNFDSKYTLMSRFHVYTNLSSSSKFRYEL